MTNSKQSLKNAPNINVGDKGGMQMNDIEKAIKLLKSEGYFVKKITETQLEDIKKCEEKAWCGECECCSCSICIMQ